MSDRIQFIRKIIWVSILVIVLIAVQSSVGFAANNDVTIKRTTIKSVEAVNDEYIKIKWSKVSNAEGYQVYRSTSKDGKYMRIATVKDAKRTYSDKTVKPGKKYYYKVRAYIKIDGKKKYGKFSSKKSAEITSVTSSNNKATIGTAGIPNYITEEVKRVADVVKSKQTTGSLTFTAMSDFHVEVDTEITYGVKNNLTSCSDAGLALTELQKYLKLDFAAMLGDYSWMDSRETVNQVKKDISYVKSCMSNGVKGIPSVWITGNHDINYGANSDRRMTEDELYEYITSNNVGTVPDKKNIGRNYGYIDFEEQKIRCIYLNTVDSLDYPDNTDGMADDASEVTAIQARWLADTGLDFSDKKDPKKWGVVILSHHCISIFPQVTEILTAYKDGKSGSVKVTTNSVTSTVSYDFTSVKRGEIICAIHGHNHNFIAKKISSEPWYRITKSKAWLWSICIPNMDTTRENESATSSDGTWKNAFGEFNEKGWPVYYRKTQGTATSTSFCVITIDRKNRKIHAIAYGAGRDREFSY